VFTGPPADLVVTIPPAVPKNAVGSCQLWTDCIGGFNARFRSNIAIIEHPNMTSAEYRHQYRQPHSNASLAKLEEATTP
jgi:hypothetical protein